MGSKWQVAALAGFLGGSAALLLFVAGAWWGGSKATPAVENRQPATPDLPPPLLETKARPPMHAELQGKWQANEQRLEIVGDMAIDSRYDGGKWVQRRAYVFVLRDDEIDLWYRQSAGSPWVLMDEGRYRLNAGVLTIACGSRGNRPKSPVDVRRRIWPDGTFRRVE